MIYFKILNDDGSVNRIGMQEELPTNAIELSTDEYTKINTVIVEEAIKRAEALEFGYLNSEEGGDTVE